MTKELLEEQQPLPPKPLDPVKTECEIKVELLHRVLSEVALLSQENYKESAIDPSLEYNPDWDQLLKFALADKCVFITARYDTVLVGYLIALIGPFKHSKFVEYGDVETFYVSSAFRDSTVIFSILRLLEKELRARKVQFIMCGAPIGSRVDSLFKYFKYRPVETILYKRLDDVSKESTSSTT